MILERFQTYSELRYQEMIDILNAVSNEESATVTSGNMKLLVSNQGSIVSFSWFHVYDDLEKPMLEIVFRDGAVETFNNQWNLLNVGSSTVNVSKEEAINLAMERAKTFSWKVGSDPSTATEVTSFVILKTPVESQLSFQARDADTLYPFWRIDLHLDKIYPGGVSNIAVGLWADTGQIQYIQELAYGGDQLPEDSASQRNQSRLQRLLSFQPTRLNLLSFNLREQNLQFRQHRTTTHPQT